MTTVVEEVQARYAKRIKARLAQPKIDMASARDGILDCYVSTYFGGLKMGISGYLGIDASEEQVAHIAQNLFRKRLREHGSSFENPSVEALDRVKQEVDEELHFDELPAEIQGLHAARAYGGSFGGEFAGAGSKLCTGPGRTGCSRSGTDFEACSCAPFGTAAFHSAPFRCSTTCRPSGGFPGGGVFHPKHRGPCHSEGDAGGGCTHDAPQEHFDRGRASRCFGDLPQRTGGLGARGGIHGGSAGGPEQGGAAHRRGRGLRLKRTTPPSMGRRRFSSLSLKRRRRL